MIEIIGPKDCSEYRAAKMVSHALEDLWPGVTSSPRDKDDIRIAVSTKISGYKVQDIDIVLVGLFGTPRLVKPTGVLRGSSGNRLTPGRPFRVENFVVAIEVKDHDDRSVRVSGDQVEVLYSRDGVAHWKSATDQNVNQVHTLKAYLRDMGINAFVRRCLVFPSLSKIQSPSAVAGDFDGKQLLTAIARSSPLLEAAGKGVLSTADFSDVKRVLDAPIFKRMAPTRLDRQRMDRIAAENPTVKKIADTLGSGTTFLRGYGGTGKTVLLLQTAWKLYRDEGRRVLILTYNRALAADMRRLMALMNIPAMADEGGIRIGTVMSFLYLWFHRLGIHDGEPATFDRYPDFCRAAIDMLEEGALTSGDIEKVKEGDPDQFDFDYVFVDEGQDWPELETLLLKRLYDTSRLCIADGVDQLTRGERVNWKIGIRRDKEVTIPLKKSLRLKRNLSLFVDAIARETGMGWNAEPNPGAGGGRVIIRIRTDIEARAFHDNLVSALKDDGNSPVDMLYCVPPSQVAEDEDFSRSEQGRAFDAWGQPFWDGVDSRTRLDFPRSRDQVRIVQYASCRGLEGWTVVLNAFDDFLSSKAQEKLRKGLTHAESEAFVSPEQAAEREAWLWGMVALTRPIDTLVLDLVSPDNPFSKQILRVAKRFADFVEIMV